jgi:hypothetical protein
MAPRRKICRAPPKFYCPARGCHKELQSNTGLTLHLRAIHGGLQPANLHPQTESCALSSAEVDVDSSSILALSDDSEPETPDALDASHPGDLHGAEDWEMNDFTIDIPDRSGSPRCSSPASFSRASPSPDDEESARGIFTEYHPLINGRPYIFLLRDVVTSACR